MTGTFCDSNLLGIGRRINLVSDIRGHQENQPGAFGKDPRSCQSGGDKLYMK